MIKPILSLAILILSVLFAIFYARPEYNRMQSSRADLEKLSSVVEDTNKIKELISQTGDILDTVDADNQARFDVFLPEKLGTIRFANNLQSIGLRNGIALSGIKVEEKKSDPSTKPAAVATAGSNTVFSIGQQAAGEAQDAAQASAASKEKYTITKTNFSFATTYPSLLIFLKDLEKSLGLINVVSLSFKPLSSTVASDSKTGMDLPDLYQFTVEIETYSLK